MQQMRRYAGLALITATTLGGCGLRDGDAAAAPVASATTTPTSSPSSSVATATSTGAGGGEETGTGEETGQPPAEPTAVTTLDGALLSGYEDIDQEVAPWHLTCPPDFAETTPEAVTMGTAIKTFPDASAQATRQVAVFADVDAAVAAADTVGALARDRCAGEHEPMEDFVASRTTVGELDTGAQGVVLDTTAEDGAYSTVVFRRGNAVGLVNFSRGADAPDDADPVAWVRTNATDLFDQLCTYERSGC